MVRPARYRVGRFRPRRCARSQQCSTAIAHIGIDIGKSVFHVVELDAKGKPVFRNRFTNERLLELLTRASPMIVGM